MEIIRYLSFLEGYRYRITKAIQSYLIVLELPDGRFRMYVAAMITESDDDQARWVIVSATSDSPPLPTPS